MSILKKLAVECLPKPLLMWGKKKYYARVVPEFHEPEVAPIARFVKAGDTTIDLGANIGWYTCVLARLVGPQGKVLAVEPIPETFELLSSVISDLGYANVVLRNCAVSATSGDGVMELPNHEYGGTNFYMARLIPGSAPASSVNTVRVPLKSLDVLVRDLNIASVSFIKCDVEGHELAVLKGAQEFFRQVKPAMMIEVAGTADVQDDPGNEFFSILRGYGYEPYWFDGTFLKKRTKGHWSVNYFFLRQEHVAKVHDLIRA